MKPSVARCHVSASSQFGVNERQTSDSVSRNMLRKEHCHWFDSNSSDSALWHFQRVETTRLSDLPSSFRIRPSDGTRWLSNESLRSWSCFSHLSVSAWRLIVECCTETRMNRGSGRRRCWQSREFSTWERWLWRISMRKISHLSWIKTSVRLWATRRRFH